MIASSSEVLLTMTCKELLFSENEVKRDFRRGFQLCSEIGRRWWWPSNRIRLESDPTFKYCTFCLYFFNLSFRFCTTAGSKESRDPWITITQFDVTSCWSANLSSWTFAWRHTFSVIASFDFFAWTCIFKQACHIRQNALSGIKKDLLPPEPSAKRQLHNNVLVA